ncbi:MAG: ArsB/NhaD family transporter [archaeon]|nr:ArsB/NhaD family transporter [archaeon]
MQGISFFFILLAFRSFSWPSFQKTNSPLLSNLFSIILIVGNPTNVIACEGTHLCTFYGYTLRMILPALFGGATALLCLYLYFKDSLPGRLPMLQLDPLGAIKNRIDSILATTLTLTCLLIMSMSSFLPPVISLWVIAVFFGLFTLLKDIVFDLAPRFLPPRLAHHFYLMGDPRYHQGLPEFPLEYSIELQCFSEGSTGSTDVDPHQSEHLNEADQSQHLNVDNQSQHLNDEQLNQQLNASSLISSSRVIKILTQLPLKVLPFITGMFILVEILNNAGLIDSMASLLAPLCRSTWSAVLVMGLCSTVMCNLVNNQPMTILFTRMLLSPAFDVGAGMQGALYSLIVGSNLGADFTLIGALAGLMWRSILLDKNITISYGQFFKIGALAMSLPLLVTLGTLTGVLYLLG